MEELATGVTFEFPLLIVRSKVKVQVGRGDEGFGAQAAAVGVQAGAPVRPPAVVGAAARLAGRTFGVLLLRSGWGAISIGVTVRMGGTEAAPAV